VKWPKNRRNWTKAEIESGKHTAEINKENVKGKFDHPDDVEMLTLVDKELQAYASLYNFRHYVKYVGGNNFVKLCFKVPNPPLEIWWTEQIQFVRLCMDTVWNLLNKLYSDKGELIPGAYILPRMGIKNGVRDQLHISVALSRWRIPYWDRRFALGLRHESDLNRILKSVHALAYPILDDVEEIRADVDRLWKRDIKTLRRHYSFDETVPMVSLGFSGGMRPHYGIYVADPSATTYKTVCLRKVFKTERPKYLKHRGLDDSTIEVPYWDVFPKEPWEIMEVKAESIADLKTFVKDYMLEPRGDLPFRWQAYGYPCVATFREMLVSARSLGVKEPSGQKEQA
jgi:hypothetical protein